MKAYIFVREAGPEGAGRVVAAMALANDVGTPWNRAYEPQTFGFTNFGKAERSAMRQFASKYGPDAVTKSIMVGDELQLKQVERFLAAVDHPSPLEIHECRASEYLEAA